MNRLLFLFLALVFYHPLSAQKELNIWYFGGYAGLDFNSGSPVVLTNSAMSTYEGCSSIADANGSLLFYTDGVTVYNKDHQPMPNGTGLDGCSSSSQSSLIAKHPLSDSIYYIFTTDCVEDDLVKGLQYSKVNILLDGGRGDVTDKNIPLLAPTGEKVCGTMHRNGTDIWIVTHQYDSDAFYAYLLTKTGLSTPVISHAGVVNTGGDSNYPKANGWGYIKISPDGSKLVNCAGLNVTELFDFDNSTGIVSNELNLNINNYSVEFSPDSRKLYVESVQFDLAAGTPSDILNSRVNITNGFTGSITGLQLAPDGKIYIARGYYATPDSFLDVIDKPNNPGISCDFINKAIYLKGKASYMGLPNQIVSYKTTVTGNFTYSNPCLKQPVNFSAHLIPSPDSVQWNFDDPGSGANNASALFNPAHVFMFPGTYSVKLIYYFRAKADSVIQQVKIKPAVAVDLGPDIIVGKDTSVIIHAPDGFTGYTWNTGSHDSQILLNQFGTYWVEVSDGCTHAADTIHFVKAYVDHGSACLQKNISFTAHSGLKPDSVHWDFDDPDSGTNNFSDQLTTTHTFNTARIYKVKITFYFAAKVLTEVQPVEIKPFTHISLGPDVVVCKDAPVRLHAGQDYTSYLWNTGSTDSSIVTTQPGVYWVKVGDSCSYASDTLRIIPKDIYIPDLITPNADARNDYFEIKGGAGRLSIYNRWGARVYENNDYKNEWGPQADPALYYYFYDERQCGPFRGWIEVIR